jgi:NAD(P)-dependent dehydrogenase (short-subunit alcohol dehydrogenase family)
MRSLITGSTGRVGSVVAQRRAAETLLQRVGSPDDVADAVIYLAGAEFVTGTSLVVDGGRLLQSGIGERP